MDLRPVNLGNLPNKNMFVDSQPKKTSFQHPIMAQIMAVHEQYLTEILPKIVQAVKDRADFDSMYASEEEEQETEMDLDGSTDNAVLALLNAKATSIQSILDGNSI